MEAYNLQNALFLTLEFSTRSAEFGRCLARQKASVLAKLGLKELCVGKGRGDGEEESLNDEVSPSLGSTHALAIQLTSCLLRLNHKLDISDILGTLDEQILEELVDQMQKSEIQQIWDTLYCNRRSIFGEVRKLSEEVKFQINNSG